MSTIQIIPTASENIVLEFNCKQVGKAYMLFQLVQHVQKHGEGLHAPESSMMLTRRMTMQEICKKSENIIFVCFKVFSVVFIDVSSALLWLQCSVVQCSILHCIFNALNIICSLHWTEEHKLNALQCTALECTALFGQFSESRQLVEEVSPP